jgi:peptidase M28-like protein/PDZ domain-containing protein/PA domain-containing protein
MLGSRLDNQSGPYRRQLLGGALAAFLALALAGAAPAQAPATAPALAVAKADAARYDETVKTLASPEMEGRGAGTKGIERAARMLEERYRSLGLEPAGTEGYFQPFTVTTGAKLASHNDLQEDLGGTKKTLKLNEDFVPFSFSSSGQAEGPLVFAGYGVSAAEFGYDDYAGVDVQGKIVVLVRYEPTGFAAKGGHQGLTQHAALISKAINARNHGAKAVVIVNGKLPDGEEDLLTRFGSVSGPENAGVLLVQVKNKIAEDWFAAAGKSLAAVQDQINGSTKPASFAFPATQRLSVAVDIDTLHASVNNVLAYLPGKSDEYVIVGAHYDHLGYGNADSLAPSQIGQIHPGADDNASGTSGVLELARLFAPLKGQLARGILFMSFAGEELGLLGSAHWAQQPTRPLGKAIAMINMDMIGRIKGEKVYVGGVGTGSTFRPILAADQKNSPFHFEYSAGGYAASDHTSFVARKIPVLFFFSGLHSDYHKPSDTWEKINAADAARLLDFVAGVITQLDTAAERPRFITVAAEDPHSGVTSTGGGGGYGPWFGSIPDFGQSENGVRFSDIQPGSPAAKAGLKAGDVLVDFAGKPIRNLYDFTDALQRSKVGDVVNVTVLRDGKPLKASVTLVQRR